MDELHTDADFDLLLMALRPTTPAEEAACAVRRADLADYLDELGFRGDAAFVRGAGGATRRDRRQPLETGLQGGRTTRSGGEAEVVERGADGAVVDEVV